MGTQVDARTLAIFDAIVTGARGVHGPNPTYAQTEEYAQGFKFDGDDWEWTSFDSKGVIVAAYDSAVRSFIIKYNDLKAEDKFEKELVMSRMPFTTLPLDTWEHIDALFEKYEDGVKLSQVLDSGYPGVMPQQFKDRFEETLDLDPDIFLPLVSDITFEQ